MDGPVPPAELLRRVSGVGRENPYHRALAERAQWLDLDDPVAASEEVGRRCADAIRDFLPADWSIEWRRQHFSPPFELVVNCHEPPLPYPDEHFDLVWALRQLAGRIRRGAGRLP